MLRYILKNLIKLIASLPLSWVHGLGSVIGFFSGSVFRYHRSDAMEALQRSLPEKTPAECRKILKSMYRLQGIYLMETIHYFLLSPDEIKTVVEYEGEEILKEEFAKGKGVIALTAHFGNYDIMPMATAAYGYDVTIITKALKNKALNDVWMEARSAERLHFVPSKNSYRDCLRALRQNHMIGFILDQNMKRGEGIFVDFFGKPASTSPGLAYMSAQSKVPVVPIFMYPKGKNKHVMRVLQPIAPPPDRKPESIAAATRQYNQVLEEVIRKDPEQWIWMHRRWRTQAKNTEST